MGLVARTSVGGVTGYQGVKRVRFLDSGTEIPGKVRSCRLQLMREEVKGQG
jgi:hypothetical protein